MKEYVKSLCGFIAEQCNPLKSSLALGDPLHFKKTMSALSQAWSPMVSDI